MLFRERERDKRFYVLFNYKMKVFVSDDGLRPSSVAKETSALIKILQLILYPSNHYSFEYLFKESYLLICVIRLCYIYIDKQ